MFQTADQILDFARAEVSISYRQWDSSAQRGLVRGEPLRSLLAIAFEQLNRFAKNAGGPEQAVRFISFKPSVLLTSLQSAWGELKPTQYARFRKTRVGDELLIGPEG